MPIPDNLAAIKALTEAAHNSVQQDTQAVFWLKHVVNMVCQTPSNWCLQAQSNLVQEHCEPEWFKVVVIAKHASDTHPPLASTAVSGS
jgi:hypothetical protein